MSAAFVVWLTGRPGSGKSTLAAELLRQLERRRVDVGLVDAVALRDAFGMHPEVTAADRDRFYDGLVHVVGLLHDHGVPVVIDAQANLRAYREKGRSRFPAFAEVLVDCPARICRERRPDVTDAAVAEYEPPARLDVAIATDHTDPGAGAAKIVEHLLLQRWVPSARAGSG